MHVAVANEIVSIQRNFLWGRVPMEERLLRLLGKRYVKLVRMMVLEL